MDPYHSDANCRLAPDAAGAVILIADEPQYAEL